MGNDASKQAADVRYLSERVPFDEAEVDRLLFCGSGRDERSPHAPSPPPSSCTFVLSQWSQRMPLSPLNEQGGRDHLALLGQVERDILPAEFTERLGRLLHLIPATRNHSEWEKLDDWSRRAKMEAYLEVLANCCGRRGLRAALGTLFQLGVPDRAIAVHNSKDLTDVNGHEIKAPVVEVLDLAYRMALATEIWRGEMSLQSCDDSCSKLEYLASSCIDYVREQRLRRSVDTSIGIDDADLDRGWCSKMDFIEWTEATLPMVAYVLPSFQHMILFPDRPAPPPTIQEFHFPKLSEASSFWNDDAPLPVLFSFGCMSKSLGGEWHRLYTSCSDGLSFGGLQNALRGYSGPTLLVIRASDCGSVFGAFTASPWKESKNYFGTDDCFLYQLSPEFTVCRPSGRSRNYMFCRSSSQVYSGQAPKGIGFGGSSNRSPRLFLDESFCGCFVSSQDTTFEKGFLLPRTDAFSQKTFFSAEQIEVWGCGGGETVAAALSAQNQDRAIRESYLNQARRVDKTAFVSDLRTGLIDSKVFGHMDDIRGSTHNVLLNGKYGKESYF